MKWPPWGASESIEDLKVESRDNRDSLAEVVAELKGYIAELRDVTVDLKGAVVGLTVGLKGAATEQAVRSDDDAH